MCGAKLPSTVCGGGNYRQLLLSTETKANNDEKSSIGITFSTVGNSTCRSGTKEKVEIYDSLRDNESHFSLPAGL